MIFDDRGDRNMIAPPGRADDMEALARLLRYAMTEAERLGLHITSHHAELAHRSVIRQGETLQS